jgi:NADH:ubiquinone oxidoreductase subunit 6 (subunit J)/NADH:ubiquinone oxidoreductase subunit 3 (subunit A)
MYISFFFLTSSFIVELLFPIATLKSLLPLLAIISGIFVIWTKNAIISVFNLIVLYILVAFYLIYIGVTYLGISYILIYIGAIAILFLFIIMMIDIEVVEKRNNNYLPLLFLLLSGFIYTLKDILYNIGLIKFKSVTLKEELILIDNTYGKLFNYDNLNNSDKENKDYVDNIYNKYENYFDKLRFDFSIKDFSSKNFEGNISKLKEEYIPLYNENMWLSNFSEEKDIKKLIKFNKNKEVNENNIYRENEYNEFMNNDNYILKKNMFVENSSSLINNIIDKRTNYLLVTPNWNSTVNRITQVTAVGDVLYTVYHSYIYIISVILLLGMVGAIILTTDSYQEIKVINISKNKNSSVFFPYYIINVWNIFIIYYNNVWNKKVFVFNRKFLFLNYREIINKYAFLKYKIKKNIFYSNIIAKKNIGIPSFFYIFNNDDLHSEGILGNLTYFIIANLIIALLLLGINYYFSLSVKYLEKGGGFECGFTSFVQTRERFNIIFYRVSLLFLVFDLEIILAFPYTAIYQKNQNISKNNVLIFLYILIVGFIYELKEGALNIVKKAHSTEININNK